MSNQWSNAEVQTFLCLVADERIQSELDGMIRNETVFREISELMAKHGHQRTPKQCREKLKKLRGDYRKIKDHNGRSGADRRNWKWFDQMDAIYGNRPANNGRQSSLDTGTVHVEAIMEDACDDIESTLEPPNLPASQNAPAPSAESSTPLDSSSSLPSTSQSTTERQPSVLGKRKRKDHGKDQGHISVLKEQQELDREQREQHLNRLLAESHQAREQEASLRAQEASTRAQEVATLGRAIQQEETLQREQLNQNAAFNQAFLGVLGELVRALTHRHV